MTDATGAFQLPLFSGVDDSGQHVLELVQWRSRDSDGLPHGPRATIALPREIDARTHDLGDVVLKPLSLPFAGRVIDAEGEAIPGVAIIVSTKIDHEDGTARWEELPRLASWSDAQGYFQCRGDWPLSECRLHARATGYLPQRSEVVTAGALELRFQLSRGGVLEGRVQHDAAVLPSDIRISASSQASSFPLTTTAAEGGAFRIAGLPSGMTHVLVRYRGIELAKIEDVAIAASGITRDQRLDPLDLTRLMRSVRLHIVERSGRRLEDLHLYAKKEEHITWRQSLALDSTSHTQVHLPHAASNLWVEARGCLPLHFDATTTEVELILQRGPRLRIESNAPLALVSIGDTATHFVLELDEADADPAWQSYLEEQDHLELNRYGQALLDLPRAGRYRLSWPEFDDLVTRFEVLDLETEQVVKVELPWAMRKDSEREE